MVWVDTEYSKSMFYFKKLISNYQLQSINLTLKKFIQNRDPGQFDKTPQNVVALISFSPSQRGKRAWVWALVQVTALQSWGPVLSPASSPPTLLVIPLTLQYGRACVHQRVAIAEDDTALVGLQFAPYPVRHVLVQKNSYHLIKNTDKERLQLFCTINNVHLQSKRITKLLFMQFTVFKWQFSRHF